MEKLYALQVVKTKESLRDSIAFSHSRDKLKAVTVLPNHDKNCWMVESSKEQHSDMSTFPFYFIREVPFII